MNMDSRLYQASLWGDVRILDNLIRENPLILENATVGRLSQTPLHIAASLGHLEFTKALLLLNEKLASIADSGNRFPLHLASEKGHVEIVCALLCADNSVCMLKDKDGWIPLHIAVIQGHVKLIPELIGAHPDSTEVRLDKEETVLHLCVKHNRLEVLKLLLDLAPRGYELVKSKNSDGNTVLHIAVITKQREIMIKYLLSIPEVKELVGDRNGNGFTALDESENLLILDSNFEEIEKAILAAGGQRSPWNFCSHRLIRRVLLSFFLGDESVKEYRGYIITAAALIATVTFQAGITPPGGVWQDFIKRNSSNSNEAPAPSPGVENYYKPGYSILASTNTKHYSGFVVLNSGSLIGSIVVIYMLTSGIALRSRLSTVLLNLFVLQSIMYMVAAYFASLHMTS